MNYLHVVLSNVFAVTWQLFKGRSSRMTFLAGSGFKMEEDHLNIKIVKALFFIMPARYLFKWKHVS